MTSSHDLDVEQAVAACYSTWADNYFELYYGEAAPYPPVHADVILDMLLADGVTTLLDVGCGPASFLRHIAETSLEWHGFDLTPEMVNEAVPVTQRLDRPESEALVVSVLVDDASTGRKAWRLTARSW